MDIPTSVIFGLGGVAVLIIVLVWVLLRTGPRTRGRLRAETAKLDESGRRSAAALLTGWSSAGGWALTAGIGIFVAVAAASALWSAGIMAEANAPLQEANDRYHEEFLACQMLTASGLPDAEAASETCLAELVQPPAAPLPDDAIPFMLSLLSPLFAALVALGVLAWLVGRRRTLGSAAGQAVSAGLRPRGILSFGPRWALALPVVTALVLCGWLVVTGLFSGSDRFGRSTMLIVERNTAATDPAVGYAYPLTPGLQSADHFPGWFYAAPLIAAAVALVVLAALLLRGLAQAPRPTDQRLFGVDDLARTLKAKLVAYFTGAALLASLGSVAYSTGGAMATLAGDLRPGVEGPEFFYHEVMLGGYWMALGGFLLTVFATLLLVVAIGAVVELSAARRLAVAVALGEEPEHEPGRQHQK